MFKRIKQRYPLKYFLGDNPNAIEIQIWATLICDLLVRIIQKTVFETGNKHWAYSTISGMIRQHLMNYFNIVAFLVNPEQTLRNYLPPTAQLSYNFTGASP